jgi:PAS domain S-box-containing protein
MMPPEVSRFGRDGNPELVVGTLQDITERMLAEDALQYRVEFERLITTISTRFINLVPAELDGEINYALQAIGQFTNVDRSYVLIFSDDGTRMDNTHEWCAAGIEPQIQNLQGVAVEDELPWLAGRLRQLEPFHIPSVAALPAEAAAEKEHFQVQGIKSLMSVPMIFGGTPVGFLGFDSVQAERVWSENSITLLRLVGEIFANALERKWAEEERARLLAAERQQRTWAETMREITLALTSQTSHVAVLDEILRQAQRIAPYSAANIALLDGKVLRIVRWRGYGAFGDEDTIANLVQSLSDFPLDAEAVRSQSPLVIHDVQQEPRWLQLDESSWIRSYLSVPICLRDRVLGLLRLDGDAPGTFSPEIAQQLRPLASAAAIAIENARLVEGLEGEVAARTAEIRAEQEKIETILRNVGDAIFTSDMDGRIQYINDAFAKLTGYTAADVLGQEPRMLLRRKMPERDQESFRLALAEGEAWGGEVIMQRKDGRTYDAEITLAPIHDAQGELLGYVSSHRDISQHKNLERARQEFMKNISHGFRTPVTSIKLAANLLLKGLPEERAQHYYQLLGGQADRMHHLIQDIVEMATLDSGQAVRAWEPIVFSAMIDTVLVRFHDRAEAAGLDMLARPVPTDLPVVKGDLGRLTQALGEVVENAVTFAPRHLRRDAVPTAEQLRPEPVEGLRPELVEGVTLAVEAVEDDGRRWVTITVQDTGPGMSPEEQEQIFGRFYRGRLAESGHVPGTGLGLSIAQEILRAHGGRLMVESQLGKGSVFTLWLPA